MDQLFLKCVEVSEVQRGKDENERKCVVREGGNALTKHKPKAFSDEEYLEAYRKSRSVAEAAKLLSVGTKTAQQRLMRTARSMGLASVRQLPHIACADAHADAVIRNDITPRIEPSSRKQDKFPATKKRLYELLEAQEYRCALSGVSLSPSTASLDHKTPVSDGGTSDMDNLWFVHCDVNKAKGTMSISEFVAMCRRVSQYQS